MLSITHRLLPAWEGELMKKPQAFSYEAIAGRHLGIFEQLLSNDAFLTDFQAEIPNLLSQRPPKGRASDSEGTARVL